LIPTQEKSFLGFVINSINMTLALTSEKKQNIYELCKEILSTQKLFTIRKVATQNYQKL